MTRIHTSGLAALLILSVLLLAVGCLSPEAAGVGGIGIAMAGVVSAGMRREAWYAAPLLGGLDTDAQISPTIVFNERTVADLSRLVGFAAADAISTTLGYAGFDFVDNVDVVDLEVYGSDQLIVGRNTPTAGIPLRGDRFIGKPVDHRFSLSRFGKMPFASSDTIAATFELQGTNIQASCSLAVPGSTSLEAQDFRPNKAPQYLGEGGGAEIAAAGSADLVLTADRAGWVPLCDLVLSALQDATAESEVGAPNPYGALGNIIITGIELPGSDQLVRGTGTGAVPAVVYSRSRQGNAIFHGGLFMDAGAAITISVTNVGPDIVNMSAGLPFFATENKSGGRC